MNLTSRGGLRVAEGFYRYWGKSIPGGGCHLLIYHCLDVAAVGEVLLQRDHLLQERLTRLSCIPKETLCRLVSFLLAIHDLGKFTDSFQYLRPDLVERVGAVPVPTAYDVRHDTLGHELWRAAVFFVLLDAGVFRCAAEGARLEDPRDVRSLIDPWIRATTGHHGAPPRAHRRAPRPSPKVADDATQWAQTVARLFGGQFEIEASGNVPIEGVLGPSAWLLAGFAVLCDWIGSNATYFEFTDEIAPIGAYWKDALEQAEAAVLDIGVLPSAVSRDCGMHWLFPGFTPTPVQELAEGLVLEDGPSLTIIEELTGGGKTEAALALAHRIIGAGLADGIYLALPTMATANAMYDRVESIYSRLFDQGPEPSLALTHSATWAKHLKVESPEDQDYDTKTSDSSVSRTITPWLADNRKKALLAAVGVGTVDHALMSVLPTKHAALRLLGLHRKVIIVDEVHAYDDYTGRLLDRLLEFHAGLGGSAILLSATLPQHLRQRFVDAFNRGRDHRTTAVTSTEYPLVTCDAGEIHVQARPESRRKVGVEFVHDLDTAVGLVRAKAEAGQCCCWIRNAIDDAIEAYDALRATRPPNTVTLFHSRFALADRMRIERRVLKLAGKASTRAERAGQIVVATQVVEQSLDLDFDFMVTDLAPMDLIIQRVGRMHRHRRGQDGRVHQGPDSRGSPTLFVLSPAWTETPGPGWFRAQEFQRAAFVYPDHGRLWLTMRALRELGGIMIPEHSRDLIEGVYSSAAQDDIPEGLAGISEKAEGARMAEASMAPFNALKWADGYRTTPTSWLPDERTPTRLGDAMTTVRLALAGSTARPLHEHRWRGWELSQVNVRSYRIAQRAPGTPELESALEAAETAMRDKGKWSVTVPLESKGGVFTGVALNSEGNPVAFTYDYDYGLRFPKQAKRSNHG